MKPTFVAAAAALSLALAPALPAQKTPGHFDRIASFATDGVCEIVSATADGMTLIYTNSAKGELGVVDIKDPTRPKAVATVKVDGEPTSVSVSGTLALATVWADKHEEGKLPPEFLPGHLYVIDLASPASPKVLGKIDIGWHPDSVKATLVGGKLVGVIAIENEPVIVDDKGLVTDDDRPGHPKDVGPAGYIQVVTVDTGTVGNSKVVDVLLPKADLEKAGMLYPSDPQPEFVDIHGTTAAVSVQESNGIAIVDISDPAKPSLTRVFSLGVSANQRADLDDNDDIRYVETYPKDVDGVKYDIPTDGGGKQVAPGSRFPDSVAFSPDGKTIFSADEGELDYTGGRGCSAWSVDGKQVWDDKGLTEAVSIHYSHYPDGRSDAKGTEIEGVTTATFGKKDFAFYLSERGSFMAVWDITGGTPRFVQLIATGIAPEDVVAIPSRSLVVAANEDSGTLTIFEGRPGPYRPSRSQPVLYGWKPWAAISGLTPTRWGSDLFGVPDNALPTWIYHIDTGRSFARVTPIARVTRDGKPFDYDGEGIVNDTSCLAGWWHPWFGGWWIASEGDASSNPNLLVQVSAWGKVMTEIQLPNAIDPAADAKLPGKAQGAAGGQKIRSNGFEGVTLSSDGNYAFAAVQRDFANEFPTGKRYTRIARYDLRQLKTAAQRAKLCDGVRCGGAWDFFFLELDSNDGDNWAGLSEIINLGNDRFLVIERDKGIGVGSTLKKLYAFSLDGLEPDADGKPDASDTVKKVLALDVVQEFSPFEKIEGLALSRRGSMWVGLDNDGGEVEPRLIEFTKFKNPLGKGKK
ncbi:MAG: esterase-like activity of phytase family protein [Planctomycetota bacterium]